MARLVENGTLSMKLFKVHGVEWLKKALASVRKYRPCHVVVLVRADVLRSLLEASRRMHLLSHQHTWIIVDLVAGGGVVAV